MILGLFLRTPYLLAATAMTGLAFSIWPRRRVRGGWYLFWLCPAVAFWALCEWLLYLGFSAQTRMVITQIQYLGILTTPPLVFLFVLAVFGPHEWITPNRIGLLFAFPVLIIGLAWSNGQHQLIWTDYFLIQSGPFPILGLKYGPMFWLMVVYIYALMTAISFTLIARVINSGSIHRAQAATILATVAVVWLANAVYVSGRSPVPGMDPTPVAFNIVAGALAWSFFRYRLLDILPVAKSEIYLSQDDGILVADLQGRLVDLNPAAERVLGLSYNSAIGRGIDQVLNRRPFLLGHLQGRRSDEVSLTVGGEVCTFDVHVSPLNDRRGRPLGSLMVMRDITGRKRAEKERERLVSELREALEEVKTLRGIVPICANCKKIRDDEGYWHQVEAYIEKHSQAKFSHSICPECARKLYPELY